MSKKSKTLPKKADSVLKEVLEKVKPPEEDLKIIENSLREFMEKSEKRMRVLNINAEIFIGGSFAKNTVIKKDSYDVDIFFRFEKKHRNISELTKKILKGMKNVSVVHGSRDYFRIKISPGFFIEIIPVLKIKNPKEAENTTDLSYLHVKYIKKKIKSEKILDEIRIAKAFCYANNCYGAESYINGFSGYGLELLIYYYKSFEKFLKEMIKVKDKLVIDIERHFRNRQVVLMDVNSAKLESPIVLIDPTYKHRNALAALSEETFEKFKNVCRKFLKSPGLKYFEKQKTDLKKIKKNAGKNKNEFILLEIVTGKQEGDVAGSKLLKFYKHLEKEIEKFFYAKNKGFSYSGKSAKCFFVARSRKEIVHKGPLVKDKKHVARFRRRHRKTFEKKGRIYAKEKIDFSLKEFVNKWKRKNKKRMREMSIKGLGVV